MSVYSIFCLFFFKTFSCVKLMLHTINSSSIQVPCRENINMLIAK